MTPPPGTRLRGGPGATYDVVGPAWADARHEYSRARKRFRNFRYPAEALDESPDDESLDVLVRVPLAATAVDPAAVAFERESVLALPESPWFLEPIDLVGSTASEGPGGWLVVADPHAGRPSDDPATTTDPSPWIATLCETLAMLEALHGLGLQVGPMGADDFLIDPSGRWFYLGTDRIVSTTGPDGARSDLTHWARLADGLLGGGASDAGSMGWALPETVEDEARGRARWLFDRVRRCLSANPASLPSTALDLERGANRSRGPLSLLRRWLTGDINSTAEERVGRTRSQCYVEGS